MFSENADGELEYGIITSAAPDFMMWLHHRVPGIIDENSLDDWLDPNNNLASAMQVLTTIAEANFDIYPVSKFVNNTKNDTSDCCMKLDLYNEKLKTTGILKFFHPIEKRKIENEKTILEKNILIRRK